MHKGSVALACEMARQCKEAGADILKMQFGHDPKDPLRYVGPEFAETVARYCAGIGLELMASLFSPEGLALARTVKMQRYKIAHQKVGDLVLVNAILSDKKETFMSFTRRADIGRLPAHARMIFCTEAYPTYPWDLKMPENFGGVWYGYSDHTHGPAACLLAVARGAQYIERHVCLGKDDLSVRDTAFSSTPGELAELIRIGRGIERICHVTIFCATGL
jgi:sialic acid synthase SpsE